MKGARRSEERTRAAVGAALYRTPPQLRTVEGGTLMGSQGRAPRRVHFPPTRPSTATTAPRLHVPSFTLPNLQALHRIARRVARRIVEDRGDKKKGGEERRRRKIKRQTAIVTEELLSLLQKASGTSSSATATSSSTTASSAQ